MDRTGQTDSTRWIKMGVIRIDSGVVSELLFKIVRKCSINLKKKKKTGKREGYLNKG